MHVQVHAHVDMLYMHMLYMCMYMLHVHAHVHVVEIAHTAQVMAQVQAAEKARVAAGEDRG